ncbi:LRR receptor-like serine threonine-protein kinase [Seminavis robusta]|uniref:LRR receptor-like serine threonine-protein kinase n=1 Tax=Seminavis robusta TaxID=568900 RepID=A0A9N8HGX7_9STRA|nr:LRR receptor-like serine threonine-protein kinase [Seminavis robusta]|eukprot:Sro532_g161520.1 LRR receptor-like serine threonine-protein kinase (887) ;mRNA; f:45997-48657
MEEIDNPPPRSRLAAKEELSVEPTETRSVSSISDVSQEKNVHKHYTTIVVGAMPANGGVVLAGGPKIKESHSRGTISRSQSRSDPPARGSHRTEREHKSKRNTHMGTSSGAVRTTSGEKRYSYTGHRAYSSNGTDDMVGRHRTHRGHGAYGRTTSDLHIPRQDAVGLDDENFESRMELLRDDHYDEEQGGVATMERRRSDHAKTLCMIMGWLVAIVFLVFLALFFLEKNKHISLLPTRMVEVTAPPSVAPSGAPSASPTWQGDHFFRLLPESSLKAITEDPESPQRKAYDWLVVDSQVQTYSSSRLVQRFALATFFHATGGPTHWNRNSTKRWLSSAHECKWGMATSLQAGILVDRDNNYFYDMHDVSGPCTKKITADDVRDEEAEEELVYEYLWFPRNDLVGTLPPEIYLLTSLRILSLFGNPELEGSIASNIGALTNLEALAMSYTRLYGSIPEEIQACSNLSGIMLSGTGLKGTIPSLGNLSSLQHLFLDFNYLTGQIPSDLPPLMGQMVLAMNHLNGTVPTEIWSLDHLYELDVRSNELTGAVIPNELHQMTSLKYWHASNNLLSGELIPTSLAIMTNLRIMSLFQNRINSTIPSDIGLLSNLTLISIRDNDMTGTLPSELGLLSLCRWLWLFGNKFVANIPSEIGNMEDLVELRLNNNLFWGSVPSELGQLPLLYDLKLNDNAIAGQLPSELGLLPDLNLMHLQNNQISGIIPTELSNLESLAELQLHGNRQLSSSIPSELGLLSNLDVLFLDDCQLNSTLPSELGQLVALELLSVSGNELSGSVPLEVTALPSLIYFNVADNRFTGNVPVLTSHHSNNGTSKAALEAFNISHNGFVGEIPIELCTLDATVFQYDCSKSLCGCFSCLCDSRIPVDAFKIWN